MNLALKPEMKRFIDEQVNAGRFPNSEAVVEAALAQLQGVDFELDEATLAAIKEGEDQADRGEGIDLDAFRAQIEKRMAAN